MQLLKRAEDILFANSRNIILFQAVVPLLTRLSIYESEYPGVLHQVSPYAAIEIADNSFYRGFWLLHQPAVVTVLPYYPFIRFTSADTACQGRDIVKLLYQRFNLHQRGITSGDDAFNAGRTNHIGVAGDDFGVGEGKV